MARRTCALHSRSDDQTRDRKKMLRLVRALGFLAPLAVALCASLVLFSTGRAPQTQVSLVLSLVILAAIAGMTTMALAAWSYMGWRLNRIAGALEATLTEEQ